MKNLNTLSQALNLSTTQLTVENILNGNLYTSKGWERFNVTDKLLENVAEQTSEILGGRASTKNRVFRTLRYGSVNHWGLRRIIISKRKNPADKRKHIINMSYCAGQDYIWECNQIRTDLK